MDVYRSIPLELRVLTSNHLFNNLTNNILTPDIDIITSHSSVETFLSIEEILPGLVIEFSLDGTLSGSTAVDDSVTDG